MSVYRMMIFAYSKYSSELSGGVKTRYEEKLKMILHDKDLFCHLEVANTPLSELQWYE